MRVVGLSRDGPLAYVNFPFLRCPLNSPEGFGWSLIPTHRLFKSSPLIADGHGECEQLLESLLRRRETDGDLAGGQRDVGRKVGQRLVHDGGRRLDGKAGLPGRVQVREGASQTSSPLPFVVGSFAGGEALQVGEELVAMGEAARTGLERDAGGEELLGAAAADLEDTFDGGAIDPGLGQGIQVGRNLVQVAEPHRFVWHDSV
jgi:hypothetical protein